MAAFEREWDDVPMDSCDLALQLKPLCMMPVDWGDSAVRQSLPAELVEFLDSEDGAGLGCDLRALGGLTSTQARLG